MHRVPASTRYVTIVRVRAAARRGRAMAVRKLSFTAAGGSDEPVARGGAYVMVSVTSRGYRSGCKARSASQV